MQRLTVADAMRRTPEPIPAQARLAALVDRFASGRDQALPVMSGDGTYAGVITLHTLDDAAADRPDATAGELAVHGSTLDPQQRLDTALDLLLRSDADGLPVLSADGDITGWVSDRDVLAAYQRLLNREHTAGRPDGALRRASSPTAVATPST